MPLSVGCPRCAAPVAETDAGWACVEHGDVEPLWRPDEASYAGFADHLRRSTAMPTYLPWPMSPGWSVSDFAAVGAEPGRARATMTCTSGTSALDGPVDVIVVAEEPGTGLGARIAGVRHADPGADLGDGPATVRVRVDRAVVPLWPVSVSASDGEWDRSVVVGEAHGRWLWLVLRPASAVLLLRDDWILRDCSQSGPELVELPFGGPAPAW
ncbi:hypothetical protein GCM10023340_44720 [Nocardioides marinquilinus]|uniref:Uncharacterized protein n=1 Tax=Nocardioides marinquilinus TaxID=1210400 RepID=A0ABP9QAU2_9ACTN